MKYAQIDIAAAKPLFTGAKLKTTYLEALDLALADATQDEAVTALLSGRYKVAHFINAHCCNVRAKDARYKVALNRADILLPDGVGVSMAGNMTGTKLAANLNGTDLVPALARKAALMSKSIFLFGGKPGTAKAAAQALMQIAPGLRIAGTRDGYGDAVDPTAVVNDINASGADIVLVALGVPMQELWIDRYVTDLKVQLCMGVGAAFDFLAGNVARAPFWIRNARLEWVWRLAMEPRRMFGRYVYGNAAFLARALVRTFQTSKKGAIAHRVSDIAIASTALVALSPLLIGTAIAIKLDSRGPALFRQTRVGKDGKHFSMLKFRSMYTDAEARQAKLLASSDRDGVCFKSKRDPRITRIGRFIRRASIDELPQIINVLRGEMSIVGPRPALPREVALYPARAMGRLAVKPGITGIWQVAGRADVSFDKMVEMDLTYASTRNLLLDYILILLTFRAVVSGRGAY